MNHTVVGRIIGTSREVLDQARHGYELKELPSRFKHKERCVGQFQV